MLRGMIYKPFLSSGVTGGKNTSVLFSHIQVASVLLEHGASLSATTKKGFTPLHLAAKYGNLSVAKLLLQKDSPVDAQGKVISSYSSSV